MKEKCLPIGTICIKNEEKLMIIGYVIDGNNDYQLCKYPNGLEKNREIIFLKKEEIKEVVFSGYEDSKFDSFSENMIRRKEELSKELSTNFSFDSNGVVQIDNFGESKDINTSFESQPLESTINPFSVAETVSTADVKVGNSDEIVNRFEFDSNGVILADNSPVNQSNLFSFDSNGLVISDNSVEMPKLSEENFEFDSSGIVTAENVNLNNFEFNSSDANVNAFAREDANPSIIEKNDTFSFDSNGVIISDGSVKPISNSFKFDEKGNIIADSSQQEETNLFKFDSNGFIVKDGGATN